MKLVLLVLAVAATFEHVRVARLVARTVTNADVTLMWFTAREFGAGHLRGPNVYGQTYGSNLEALPMEVLRRLGMGIASACHPSQSRGPLGCGIVPCQTRTWITSWSPCAFLTGREPRVAGRRVKDRRGSGP